MPEDIELNVLISNLVDQKRYSHCRLCLNIIQGDSFAKFEDCVYNNKVLLTLNQILLKLFGSQIVEDIPGIEVLCPDCVDEAIRSFKFIENGEKSTEKLHKVLNSVQSVLDKDIDFNKTNHSLLVVCDAEDSQLLYIQNEIQCSECREYLQGVEELTEHNTQEHNKYTCKQCHYTSTNPQHIEEHYYNNNSPLKCPHCPVMRCTEASLKEHEFTEHVDHNKVIYVKAKSEDNKGNKEQVKVISMKPKSTQSQGKSKTYNKCPKCGKQYSTGEFFLKHVSLCLEGKVDPHRMRSKIEKPFFCQYCGKAYSTQGGLRVHDRFVHGNAKPYICDQCGKKFTAPSYLKAHLVTHSGEKNFPCKLCTRRFVSKEALLYHTRRHTGEKPYSCDLCNEKFVNSSARADHIKYKHIGPTLSCELCSKKFVTKNFLRLHLLKHHDPSNKIYIGRNQIPTSNPGEQKRLKIRIEN